MGGAVFSKGTTATASNESCAVLPKQYNLLDMILLFDDATKALIEYLDDMKLKPYLSFYQSVNKLHSQFEKDSDQDHKAKLIYHDNFKKAIIREFIVLNAPQYIRFNDNINDRLHLLGVATNPTHDSLCKATDTAQLLAYKILDATLKPFAESEFFSRYLAAKNSVVKKKRLLLVEKDVILGKILKREFEGLRYDVVVEIKGALAASHLLSTSFDTAVINLEMTDRGGLNIIQEFLRMEDRCKSKIDNYKRPFLIAMTTQRGPSITQAAVKAGYNAVLHKPFGLEIFRTTRGVMAMQQVLSKSISFSVPHLRTAED